MSDIAVSLGVGLVLGLIAGYFIGHERAMYKCVGMINTLRLESEAQMAVLFPPKDSKP